LFSEKSLIQSWWATQQSYPNNYHAPFSLSASTYFHLPLGAGVNIRGGEQETVTSGPRFFRDSVGTLWEFCTR